MSDTTETENQKYKLSEEDKIIISEIKQAFKDVEQTRKSTQARIVRCSVEQQVSIKLAKESIEKEQ